MPTDDLAHESFPRASGYDAEWLLSLDMGPNPLWLLEDLLADLELSPDMRVLDLGCGKGATSVFLARELGVEVWAADLWIPAERNQAMFDELGVGDRVHAVHADARIPLPFEHAAFDAIVCIDAWEYVGTDDHLLPRLVRHLRPDGQLGIATPAMRREVRELGAIPGHIAQVVGWEALAWHTADWWAQQWRLGGLVEVTAARFQETGWADWLHWARTVAGRDAAARPSVEMLEIDGGELLTFALVSGRKI